MASIPIFLMLYGLSAWLLPLVAVNADFAPDPSGREVFLVTNGVHVDVVLAGKDVPERWKKQLPAQMYGCAYYGIGWGDRGFYLETPDWASLSAFNVANALFWPSKTVMHVSCYARPDTAKATVAGFRVGERQWQQLIGEMEKSWQIADSGWQLIPEAGYGQYDAFFEAKGHYHLFFTCNNWTGQCLRKAGIRTALWSPLPGGIIKQAEQMKTTDN